MGEWYVGQTYTDQDSAVLAAFRAASPIRWLQSGAPDVLVIHGLEDDLVPVEQARRLLATFKDSSVNYTYWEVPGAGHSLAPLLSGANRDSLFGLLWKQTGLAE
jgi:dipeptidyl aminopeptidase/acylaminoacyl peptidase